MLKHTEGRIVVKVDIEQKNHYSFSDGTVIRLERDYNNLDRKYTQQVMGVVISAKGIPSDSLILFHHNSLHETYQIHNHSNLSGEEIASGIKMFSIMERDCFFWKAKDGEEWLPTENYATGLRVFKPYTGLIEGVQPNIIKNTLWVTSGEFKNKVVKTVEASDYSVIFRDPTTGKDKEIIRFRPNGIEEEQREPEAIAILWDETNKVKKGELLVGLTANDCKHLNEF